MFTYILILHPRINFAKKSVSMFRNGDQKTFLVLKMRLNVCDLDVYLKDTIESFKFKHMSILFYFAGIFKWAFELNCC